MTRRQTEKLAQALRKIGDGFHLAALALSESPDGARSSAGDADSIQDDAFIDQRSPLVPPDVYLRLAREKAFPSRKVGRLVLAKWGDVRSALAGQGGVSAAAGLGGEDPNDVLRRALGFRPKGGS